MNLVISTVALLMGLTLASVVSAQTVQKRGLTLDGAKKVIVAAIAEA